VLRNNIIGTRNVYEAARQFGVTRVVFTSSNHVTGAYEGIPPTLHTRPDPKPITVHDPVSPDSYYGTGKVFGEALARQYYELHGIESVCLRIGTVLPDDDPSKDPRHRKTWLSHRDLLQLVERSLFSDVNLVSTMVSPTTRGDSGIFRMHWTRLAMNLRMMHRFDEAPLHRCSIHPLRKAT